MTLSVTAIKPRSKGENQEHKCISKNADKEEEPFYGRILETAFYLGR